MIDMTALRSIQKRLGRCPRVLDVACGTGILLQRLLGQLPDVEAYGVDVSQDMLAQAQIALKDMPNVHFESVKIGAGVTANLRYTPETFDLITCTNALHDMPEPVATLSGLWRLWHQEDNWWWKISRRVSLVSSGQLSNGCYSASKRAECMPIPCPKHRRFASKRDCTFCVGKCSR